MSIKYQSYRKLKYLPRKRLNYGQVWWVVAWITLLWQPMRPLSAAEVRSSSAVIENQRVRVVYNPATGTFDLVDKATDQAVIAGGHAEVAGWSTSATNRVRQARQMVGVDELGEASRLTIECDAPGEPTLLAEFSLYGQTNTFVILRNGIRNRTQTPLRVKEFYPVVDGQIFPGGAWSEVRTLNGDSSANQPQVTPQRFRSSANDLLLTLKQAGRRQSLVLGALKTADFTKWAHTTSKGGLNARSAVLDRTLPGVRLFSYLDCGTTKAPLAASGPRFFVRRGQSYAFGDSLFDRCFASVLFDAKEVVLEVAGLNPAKHYAVGFSWWDYDGNGRVETVAVGGAGQSHVLFEKRQLPAYAGKQQAPEERAAVIPADCYATGSFQLRFTNETNVPNAVVSEIWLWEMPSAIKLPDDWTQGHPASSSEDIRDESGLPVSACLEGSDPVGRLVEPGETYLPEDSFYVDGLTPDPFEALEKYGWQLRLATHARPNLYDFPTVCAWYAGVWKTPGAQDHPEKSTYKINTSSGLVEEAQQMKACGFLNYSRAAVRLVPDNYTRDNPQGWWDDEHWRQHGLYTPPYETSAKLGQGMH
ncbi:MAG: hypothetical protein NT154_17330, partial [Verrucomicrobia bacterium]|nr:hypothetical protein [Verrucomicrobiota bacterium]